MTLSSALLLLLFGLALLICGAEFLVRGAARLAGALGISPLVVGLTVVAFGTSSPELAVSVMSAFKGQADLALGNVVGSNIFNVLLILGLSALIVPLVVARQLVRFDVPVMIVVSIVLFALGLDGRIGRIDGAILFSGVVAYTLFLVRQSRRERNLGDQDEFEKEFGAKGAAHPARNIGLVVVGLVGLVLGSKWLVAGAVSIAETFGVSELIIGLTIVAAGTSMPEVATSVVAAVRGERDIAVGNVVGSNIFNLLCVLGLSSLVAPEGIHVSESALRLDIPVMIAVAVACLPLFFADYRIGRGTGAAFLAAYAAYLAYLILSSMGHEALASYRTAMLVFVLPVAAAFVVAAVVRGLRLRRSRLP